MRITDFLKKYPNLFQTKTKEQLLRKYGDKDQFDPRLLDKSCTWLHTPEGFNTWCIAHYLWVANLLREIRRNSGTPTILAQTQFECKLECTKKRFTERELMGNRGLMIKIAYIKANKELCHIKK